MSNRIRCTFCSNIQDKVRKLIAGPGVYICDECVKECDELLIAEKDRPTENVDPKLKCSFCAKPQTLVQKLLKGPITYICDECIDLCHEILGEEGLEPWASAYTPLPSGTDYSLGIDTTREEVFEAIV